MFSRFPMPRLLLCVCASIFITQANADQNDEITQEVNKTIIEATSIKSDKDLNLRAVVMASGHKLVNPAFLRKRLPDTAIAYARLPNIWEVLGTPSGNVLDSAVGSKAFVSAASSIKEGFATNIIPELPQESRLITQLVMQHINSPLEAVAMKSTDPAIPTADLLVSAGVDFATLDVVQGVLTKLDTASPVIQLSKPMDETGFAEIGVDGLKGQIFWNKTLSRLFIFIGQGSTAESFKSLLDSLEINDNHLMRVAEQGIDESGQGAFIWLNPPQVYGIAKKIGFSQSDLALFTAAGVSTMKSAAIGAGTSNGINHLTLAVDMPMMGLRALIPSIKSSPTFNLNGETSVIATLGLPAKSHITAYETMVSMSSPESMVEYNKFKAGFVKTLGFNVEDIFDFFGQDLSVVSGETGVFFAVRLNNKAAFKKMLERSVKDFNLTYEQREISGHLYHHLQLPNISFDEALKANLKNGVDKIAKRLLSTPTHLYWEQEGDYLLIASLPQILMDRHNVSPSVPANEWLRDTQRIDSAGALMMISAVTNEVPESVYRMQLSMLNYFGDLTDRPVDLFKLPTPLETKLPKHGSYGLKLTSSDTQLAVELTFENNPLELFGGHTYASTVVAGIATLIGVAAQEEYEIQRDRAKLIPGITAAKNAAKALDEYKDEYANYPGRAEIDALEIEVEEDTYTLLIEEKTGIVTVEFSIAKYLGGDNSLTLSPPSAESSSRVCESDIMDKYLPKSCH